MKLYEERPCPYPAKYASGLDRVELWLADRCVLTADGGWLVRQPEGHWLEMKGMKPAKLSMIQNYKGGEANIPVSVSAIDDFLTSTAPVVKGGMKVPTSSAPVIVFGSHVFVNTWVDNLLKPDDRAMREPALRARMELILRMIRESLCGMPDKKSLDEMIIILEGNDPAETAFRFAMHWLAAPLQQVGLNLQTNLWFVGERNGTGKGTLSTIMSMIYGPNNTRLLNEDELEKGGWTDVLDGALFVAWNEIRQSNKFDSNSFIKQNSTEDTLILRKRNNHAYSVINFANWFITGNKESAPRGALDLNDRRNAIFATTEDASKLLIARDVRLWMEKNQDEAYVVLAGLVYLMKSIKIDHELIAWAPETELKSEMQDASSQETDGVYWLENDTRYPRDHWLPARDYLAFYKDFQGNCANLSPKKFSGSVMGKLARKGFIEKEKKYATSPNLFRISGEKYPVWNGETNDRSQGNTVVGAIPKAKR